MKYLAEGFQYKVYTIEDNRVFKKEIPYLIRLFKIFKITRQRGLSILQSIKISINSDKKNKDAFIKILKKLDNMPRNLFANPKFIKNSSNFTQDKVIILKDYLDQNNTTDNIKILDRYFEFQKILWSYGIHDAVYKFNSNYGIDTNNNLVCIDFGEFVFTKEEAMESIQKQKWLNRPSYKNWEEDEIKRYYTEKMNEIMKIDILEQNWEK